MTPQTLAVLAGPDSVEETTREIREHGGIDDALALLPVFLAAPARRAWLLPAISDLGDARLALSLLEACVVDGRLRDDLPSELLYVLGRFGLAEAMLWHYAQSSDYYLVRDACLGLLHLPCKSLPIADAIAAHEGKPLFPEFLHCLAVKTGDRSWIARLLAWGAYASTDCNGGLALGIAMFGDRAAFHALLWNPDWERPLDRPAR